MQVNLTPIVTANGKNTWKCWVIDNVIYRSTTPSSTNNESFAEPIVVEKGKNIGKKNETTPHQQAVKEANTLWKKKMDSLYSPMLASPFSDKHLKLPFAASKKIDGIRMVSSCRSLVSRRGKPFKFLHTIRKELDDIFKINDTLVLDGELYSHDLTFNQISGIVRASKNISAYDHLIEYHVFDIIDSDKTYAQRVDMLKRLEKTCKTDRIKFVYYDVCESYDDVKTYHDKFVRMGYEGVMCRNLDSVYEPNKRSKHLQKYKEFIDKEYEIVCTGQGRGSDLGAIIFTCKTPNGDMFEVRPRGTLESRRDMFKREETYVGKMLTVRYQDIGAGDVPRFPVGIEVRDYE